jgi:tRNA1(Val) A37 N6-methylase TrmN6
MPPVIVHDEEGNYKEEIKKIFKEWYYESD